MAVGWGITILGAAAGFMIYILMQLRREAKLPPRIAPPVGSRNIVEFHKGSDARPRIAAQAPKAAAAGEPGAVLWAGLRRLAVRPAGRK